MDVHRDIVAHAPDLPHFFSSGGPLAAALPGYGPRPAQLALASAVAETLSDGGVLLAEAGTGTGKTLAYLVPAVAAGKKVVVSTATKTLQAQILEKDVPLLSRALGRPVAAVLLKGRQNYLCLRRFERFRAAGSLRLGREGRLLDRLEHWAGRTETGDRAELSGVPEDFWAWNDVCSTAETCWGSRCPREEECFLLRRRRAALKAQVLVVNHHLFFADLALRSSAPAEVFPRYGAVIFDEAHHLEQVATHFFGVRVSSYRLAELVRDGGSLDGLPESLPEGLRSALDHVARTGEALWGSLPAAPAPTRFREGLAGDAGQRLEAVLAALAAWTDRLAPRQAESREAEGLFRRSEELRRDLARFAEAPEPGEVRWCEARGRGTFLHAAPVEVADALGANLFTSGAPVVLTSATLRAGGSFEYLRSRLGVRGEARELAVESPFDFRRQCLLYVPEEIPEPNAPDFPGEAVLRIRELLTASRGRAFCLFTSHRVLQAVAAGLRGTVPYRLLAQGEAPREVLLRRFQDDVHSVLLGAQAFWEGVDVPGEALSAVIIDRIPFASPSEPLVEARVELLRSRGESPFWSYQVPAAAMALRQGVGRLVRTMEDRGVVAILDRRLLASSYAGYLRESLPPMPLTRDLTRVKEFLERGPSA
ncbi:MAG: ATP-dependent DNA helicase [Deltaproteobacteria bacterium]|nr:ATP-dependent DNA helicase [Deltaproteobacteria bacterium]